MSSKKKNPIKAHGKDQNGKEFWLGPSGIHHYDYGVYLLEIEKDIKDGLI